MIDLYKNEDTPTMLIDNRYGNEKRVQSELQICKYQLKINCLSF